MSETLNLTKKQKLAKKAEPFTLKERIMYKMGQNNIMCRCLTTSKAQIILKELHGVVRGRFVTKNSYKEISECRLLVANFIQRYS